MLSFLSLAPSVLVGPFLLLFVALFLLLRSFNMQRLTRLWLWRWEPPKMRRRYSHHSPYSTLVVDVWGGRSNRECCGCCRGLCIVRLFGRARSFRPGDEDERVGVLIVVDIVVIVVAVAVWRQTPCRWRRACWWWWWRVWCPESATHW